MNFEINDVIVNRYKLLDFVGGGQFSLVYKAIDLRLGRLVAIKFQSISERSDYSTEVQCLIREAQITSKLNCFNIVRLYDFGEVKERNFIWLTMEFVEGETLRCLIDEKYQFSMSQVISIMLQISKAVAHCHNDHDFYQIDIKPNNIVYNTKEDKITLFDFGTLSSETYKNEYPLGTPEYIAPELLLGKNPSKQSDIFSLGILFFELLTLGDDSLFLIQDNRLSRATQRIIINESFCLGFDVNLRLEQLNRLENSTKLSSLGYNNLIVELIDNCLCVDKNDRINISEIISLLERINQIIHVEFDVFISHRSTDFNIAYKVYSLLVDNGHRPFLSKKSLPAMGSVEYMDSIYNTIDDCKHFILITSSSDNVQSKWVKAEWSSFLGEKLANRKSGNILTVIDGEMSIGQLPLPLRQYEVFKLNELNYDLLSNYLK